jgi:hypothetical protein
MSFLPPGFCELSDPVSGPRARVGSGLEFVLQLFLPDFFEQAAYRRPGLQSLRD